MIAPIDTLELDTEVPGVFAGIADQSTLCGAVDVTRYGYDAAEDSTSRKSRSHQPMAEDAILTATKRRKVATTAADLTRNFELAGWLVRRHLDYVCDHQFYPRTGNAAFDEALAEFVAEELFEPDACEITEQSDLDEVCRLVEAHALKDGDHIVLLTRFGKVQLVEYDCLRDPEHPASDERWVQGVRVNRQLAHTGYCLWQRGKGGRGYENPTTVGTQFAVLYGGRERANQTRGTSPLAASCIRTQDLYESMGHALNLTKLHNQLGIVFTSGAIGGVGTYTNTGTATDPNYRVKFGSDGPWSIGLRPGDDAKLLQSNTPSLSFQEYTTLMVRVVLLALDLPFSFFDSSKANFFGNKSELYHYLRGCKHKRRRVRRLRDRVTAWKVARGIAEGRLRPPRSVNLTKRSWQWNATGVPWWNPSAEMKADIDGISAGFGNPIDTTMHRDGGDVFENLRKTAEVIAKARSLGLKLPYDNGQPVSEQPLFNRQEVPA